MWLLNRLCCFFGDHGGRVVEGRSISTSSVRTKVYLHVHCDVCGFRWMEEMGLSQPDKVPVRPSREDQQQAETVLRLFKD